MRVLQFGRFYLPSTGGIERHALALGEALASLGVDVVNLVASQDLSGHDTRARGVHVVQSPSLGVLFSTAMAPLLPLQARSLHRRQAFDLIHVHFPDPLSHLASLLLPANVPRVITWHSDIVRQKRLLRLYQPWVRSEVMRAKALIAATEAHFSSSTQIPATYPAQCKHVIPYGLDLDRLTLDAQTQQLASRLREEARGRPIVFALGRHVYYKGFDVLIQAMREVDAFLILGGDGPLHADLAKLAQTVAGGSRIRLVGRIPDAQLPAYFHACDMFCLPSVEPSEAFGLVQVEAMACGKPVVRSQLNNGVNAVGMEGQTSISVPPRDPRALAKALNLLVNAPDICQMMGASAQTYAWTNYSAQAMGKATLALYEQVLSSC